MLIDTHAHLTDKKFAGLLDQVLAEAKKAGVERILIPTTGILDAKKAVELAREHQEVWAMAGIHPEVLADETNTEHREEWLAADGDWIKRLEETINKSDRVVGIGEIGLDFYWDKEKTSKKLQLEIFQGQLELALKLDLPVVIHMRGAEAEVAAILRSTKKLPRGQFHCWSGSKEFLDLALTKGFYVSFCGNITFKSAGDLRELAKIVPLDRLLLETDSPYLAPEPKRGSVNTPSNVKILAEYLANLLGIEPETLINQTTKNALCLFFAGG